MEVGENGCGGGLLGVEWSVVGVWDKVRGVGGVCLGLVPVLCMWVWCDEWGVCGWADGA
ncbi:MAG: hypothetical protein Marn2KO_36800 [Marinobacter nauticus]